MFRLLLTNCTNTTVTTTQNDDPTNTGSTGGGGGNKRFQKYLNINLSHEVWSDIKIDLWKYQTQGLSPVRYILLLNIWWQGFNFVCFVLLKQFIAIIFDS